MIGKTFDEFTEHEREQIVDRLNDVMLNEYHIDEVAIEHAWELFTFGADARTLLAQVGDPRGERLISRLRCMVVNDETI